MSPRTLTLEQAKAAVLDVERQVDAGTMTDDDAYYACVGIRHALPLEDGGRGGNLDQWHNARGE